MATTTRKYLSEDTSYNGKCACDKQKSIKVRGAVMSALFFVPSGVRFSLGPVTVSSQVLRNVAIAIASDKIKICVVPAVCLSHGLLGAYNGQTNTMIFADSIIGTQMLYATAIHEAVHASVDLRKIRVLEAHDEAAAFITDALYALYALPGRIRSSTPIESEAIRIAQAIRNSKLPRQLQTNVVELSALYRLLQSSSGYGPTIFKTFSVANG